MRPAGSRAQCIARVQVLTQELYCDVIRFGLGEKHYDVKNVTLLGMCFDPRHKIHKLVPCCAIASLGYQSIAQVQQVSANF